MMQFINRARWTVAVGAVALMPLLVGGCNVKQDLLEPQQPGVIGPTSVTSPTGAEALRIGALGQLKSWVAGGGNNGSNVATFSDLVTDEWATGDTFSQHNEADQRTVQSSNSVLSANYTSAQQARGFALTAINALKQYVPTATSEIGELYFAMGFAELSLSEDFCNGVPFGITVNGVPTYTAPLTNADGLKLASARFDTGLAIATGTDAGSVAIHRLNEIAKARAQIDLGNYAAAAALVADVPTNYQYLLTFSLTTTSPEVYTLNGVQASSRFVVGDSFSIINGAVNVIKNALPFASAGDPRVPITGSTTNTKKAIDGSTPWAGQLLYGQVDPYPVLTGIDARLIEAEAKLNANDFAGMFATLNALRASTQTIGNKTIPVMAALPTVPATKDAALTLFFREKAFWQFGRGWRMGDLRRLIRQYGRTQDTTFPGGSWFKGGTYGTDVNLPMVDTELTNPNYHGCIDRNA